MQTKQRDTVYHDKNTKIYLERKKKLPNNTVYFLNTSVVQLGLRI